MVNLRKILILLLILLLCYHFIKSNKQKVLSKESHILENLFRLKSLQKSYNNFTYIPVKFPKTVLAIVTTDRNYGHTPLYYPIQVILSFLSMMRKEELKDVSIFVCNAGDEKSQVMLYLKKHLRAFDIAHISNPTGYVPIEKETNDYVSCLESAYRRYPGLKYLILNEDDGIPLQSFFKYVNQIISQLEFRSKMFGQNNVGHIKLHHPSRLRKIPFLIFTFALPITIVILLYILISSYFKIYAPHLIYLVLFAVLVTTVYITGANGIGMLHYKFSLTHFPLVPAESCCTVSVLYPRNFINNTIDYLRNSNNGKQIKAKDTALDEITRLTGMEVLMTEFNLVKHIGLYSTLHDAERDTFS